MSTQNIVISVFLIVLSTGVFLAIENYEEPAVTVRRADLSTDDLDVLVQRSSCFGPCPVYSMVVRGNGSVRFVGQRYTEVVGGIDGTLTDDQLFLIASELDRSNFLSYQPIDGCLQLATDHPSVTLWVKWRGKERKVERYLGCKKEEPDPVPTLSRRIDEIVNTNQWIGDGASKSP